MPRRLTLKEKTFCEEFVANGGNASRAYQYAYALLKMREDAMEKHLENQK